MRLAILVTLFSGFLYAQGTPDCQFSSTFSAQAPGNAQANKATPCVAWRLTYYTAAATGVSAQLEGTDDIAGAPNAGGWTALTPVPGTTSPAVGTTNGEAVYCCDYYPWIRVNPATFTFGAGGLLTARTYGYKGTSAQAQGTGLVNAADGLQSIQYNGGGVLAGNATLAAIITGTSPPAAPAVATAGTPGATTYGYKIAFCYPTGCSAASPETKITTGNAVLDGTNYNVLGLLPACSGPNEQVAVFMSTHGGNVPANGWIATVACGATYNHQGANGATGDVPSSDTTAGISGLRGGFTTLMVGNQPPVGIVSLPAVSAIANVDSSTFIAGQFINLVNRSTGTGVNMYGLRTRAYQEGGTGNTTSVFGTSNQAGTGLYQPSVATNVNNAYGARNIVSIGAPGTISNIHGTHSEANATNGTIANQIAGVFSTSISGSATTTNVYGIQVANISGAATLNRAISTGTGAVYFGDLTNLPKLLGNTSAPGIAGCAASIVRANDLDGRVASGTTGACAITLTFTSAYSVIPACTAQDETTGVFLLLTPAVGGLLISGTTVSGDVIAYHCIA